MKEIIKELLNLSKKFRCNNCGCIYISDEYKIYIDREPNRDITTYQEECPKCKGVCRIQTIDNLIPDYDD